MMNAANSIATSTPDTAFVASVTMLDVAHCFEANHKRFTNMARRLEHSAAAVEELLADLLVELLETVPSKLADSSKLENYLTRAVHYKMCHHVRDEKKRKQVGVNYAHELSTHTDDDTTTEGFMDAGVSEDNVEANVETQQRLAVAGNLMRTVEKRMPLAYKYWYKHVVEEMSYAEISAEDGTPEARIRGHKMRIEKALQELAANNPGLVKAAA